MTVGLGCAPLSSVFFLNLRTYLFSLLAKHRQNVYLELCIAGKFTCFLSPWLFYRKNAKQSSHNPLHALLWAGSIFKKAKKILSCASKVQEQQFQACGLKVM